MNLSLSTLCGRRASSSRNAASIASTHREATASDIEAMAVVGLDFGCMNAVVAQAERGGVTVLLNENSKR